MKAAAFRARNLGFVLCLCSSTSALGEPSRVCELAAKRGGSAPYAVKVEPAKDGSRTLKADIDLDGIDDELRWSDSTFTLTLASNGKSFTLEQERLRLMKYESRYYVIATRVASAVGPWQREVFAVAREGFTSICSFAGKGQEP